MVNRLPVDWVPLAERLVVETVATDDEREWIFRGVYAVTLRFLTGRRTVTCTRGRCAPSLPDLDGGQYHIANKGFGRGERI